STSDWGFIRSLRQQSIRYETYPTLKRLPLWPSHSCLPYCSSLRPAHSCTCHACLVLVILSEAKNLSDLTRSPNGFFCDDARKIKDSRSRYGFSLQHHLQHSGNAPAAPRRTRAAAVAPRQVLWRRTLPG